MESGTGQVSGSCGHQGPTRTKSRAADGELGFANGQHWTRALLDADVEGVLVVDFELVEAIVER